VGGAARLAFRAAAGKVQRLLSRVAISLAAGVVAIIFVAAAIVFLGAALYLLLAGVMSEPLAALVVGLVGLALAGLIGLAASMIFRRTTERRATGVTGSSRAGDINDIAAEIGSLAAREMNSAAKAHPYHTVALALLTGLAVGISPELRNFLKGVLKD
jgi:small-conductance mechanosensitive channel